MTILGSSTQAAEAVVVAPALDRIAARLLHIPVVDGVRALSILVVFLAHYVNFLVAEVIPGGFGVTMFFFISGFLITHILLLEYRRSGRISYKNFIIRRFLRLGPALYIYLAILTAVFAITFHVFSLSSLLIAVTYTYNYAEFLIPIDYPMPLWSLAIEEHFYLVFPWLLLATMALRNRSRLLIFGSLLVVVLGWRIYMTAVLGASWERIYVGTDTRADSILYGVMLSLALDDRDFGARLRSRLNPWAAVVGCFLILVSLAIRDEFFRQTLRYSLQGVGLFLTVGALICNNLPRALVDFLSTSTMRYIGRISYSLYLYHLTVLAYFDRLDLFPPIERAIVGAAVSIAFAMLSYHGVERPFLRLRRSYGSHAELDEKAAAQLRARPGLAG